VQRADRGPRATRHVLITGTWTFGAEDIAVVTVTNATPAPAPTLGPGGSM
jgi:hypothetical protein